MAWVERVVLGGKEGWSCMYKSWIHAGMNAVSDLYDSWPRIGRYCSRSSLTSLRLHARDPKSGCSLHRLRCTLQLMRSKHSKSSTIGRMRGPLVTALRRKMHSVAPRDMNTLSIQQQLMRKQEMRFLSLRYDSLKELYTGTNQASHHSL